MPDISPSIPIVGQPNSSEEPKIVTALGSIVATINNLDKDNLSATAGILDTQLAAPNNALWRTLRSQPWSLTGATAAGTYLFGADGTQFLASAGTGKPLLPISVPTLAEYAASTKTLRGRVSVEFITNTIIPGVAMTFGLYPVPSVGGGVSPFTQPSLGTVVAGSTVVVGPNGVGRGTSAGFDISAGANTYLLGVTFGSATAANSFTVGSIDFQFSNT